MNNKLSDKVYGIIYKIENKINGKVYIGQTTRKGGFDARYGKKWWENTHNKHLKKSVNKYGVENFEVTKVLRKCYKESTLNYWEAKYIKEYDSTNPDRGYNKTTGGDNYKLSEETKRKISNGGVPYILNKKDVRDPLETFKFFSIVQYGEILPLIDIYKNHTDEKILNETDDIDLINAYFIMCELQGRFYEKVGLSELYSEDGYVTYKSSKEEIERYEYCSYLNIKENALDLLFEKNNGKYKLVEKLKEMGYIIEDDPEFKDTRRYKVI